MVEYNLRRNSSPLRNAGYAAVLISALTMPVMADDKDDEMRNCETACTATLARQSGDNRVAPATAGKIYSGCIKKCNGQTVEDARGWALYCDSLGKGVRDRKEIPSRLQPLHDLLIYLEKKSGTFRYLGLTCLNVEPRKSADRVYDDGETLVEALVVERQPIIPVSYDKTRGSGFPFNQRLPLVAIFPENDAVGKRMENAHYGTVAFLNPKSYPIPEPKIVLPRDLQGAVMLGGGVAGQLPKPPKKKKGGLFKAFVRGMNPFRQDKPRKQISPTIPDPIEVIYRPIGMEESSIPR